MQKKSSMASMANASALYNQEAAANCGTAKMLENTNWFCEVCGGRGHEYWECPTKKRCDAFAAKNGESAIWGAWKYHKYYCHLTAEERKLHKELASAAAGRKRLYKQAFKASDASF